MRTGIVITDYREDYKNFWTNYEKAIEPDGFKIFDVKEIFIRYCGCGELAEVGEKMGRYCENCRKKLAMVARIKYGFLNDLEFITRSR